MTKMNVTLIVVGLIVSLVSIVSAIPGTATFYNHYVPSACFGNQNNGVMIAAASDVFWKNKAACGKMYNVRCTGPTNPGIPHPCRGKGVTVKIVDYCPSCAGTIDLSREAFAMIADPVAGKIKVEYTP
ncbi:Eg45-like domain containing protein [Thalictrum thalictroides]|uniref:Eg45-like domain containing protein n=1 Tax=Thalictrum thalictroides TaxID=46969 RepID=A0A7J6V938_THATH|nr:Eg45-like domain containing protein [Thalictrum thalictroides]